MLKRSEGYFRGKNDFELFFQAWTPEDPLSTLVITHGLGEHTECYQRLINGLSSLRMQFFSWDLRGHGRSEGKRGVITDFADLSEDLIIFTKHIRKEISDLPMSLLGHSMGGLINLNTLIDHPDIGFKAAVFSSPLLGVQLEVPEIKKVGARYLAQYFPQFTMWNEISDSSLTHDLKIIEEFEKDPLRHDRISPRLYLEMLEHIEKVRRNGADIHLPVLFQLAGQDKVVNTDATLEFCNEVSSKDKTTIIYDQSLHEIYNDVEREVAYKDLANWFRERSLG